MGDWMDIFIYITIAIIITVFINVNMKLQKWGSCGYQQKHQSAVSTPAVKYRILLSRNSKVFKFLSDPSLIIALPCLSVGHSPGLVEFFSTFWICQSNCMNLLLLHGLLKKLIHGFLTGYFFCFCTCKTCFEHLCQQVEYQH